MPEAVRVNLIDSINHNHNPPIKDNPGTLRNKPGVLSLRLQATQFLKFLYPVLAKIKTVSMTCGQFTCFNYAYLKHIHTNNNKSISNKYYSNHKPVLLIRYKDK